MTAPRHFFFSVGFAALASALFVASPARAYCRATTCDPEAASCATDEHGCFTDGLPISWDQGRVRLSVDGGGSVLRKISGDDALTAVTEALSQWTNATCNSKKEHPAIDAAVGMIAAGAMAKFNSHGANESVVLYRDDIWPYGAKAVAKTTLGFNLDTGEILDADVQLNSADFDLAVSPDAGQVDVVAVLTHEIGHVLGLGHSDVPGATMQPEASGFGTAELRSLERDDMEGICAIYPPDSNTRGADAKAGDSASAATNPGCSLAPTQRAPWPGIAVVGIAAVCAIGRRKRASSRSRACGTVQG